MSEFSNGGKEGKRQMCEIGNEWGLARLGATLAGPQFARDWRVRMG